MSSVFVIYFVVPDSEIIWNVNRQKNLNKVIGLTEVPIIDKY